MLYQHLVFSDEQYSVSHGSLDKNRTHADVRSLIIFPGIHVMYEGFYGMRGKRFPCAVLTIARMGTSFNRVRTDRYAVVTSSCNIASAFR